VTALVTAVRGAAVHEAQALLQIVALGIALAAVAAAVLVLLGPAWLAFGAGAAGVLGALAAAGRRRLYRAYERAWDDLTDAARDTEVLIAASAELRGHAREDGFTAALLEKVERMGREERVATALQAAMGLFPAGLAVAAVAGPVRMGLGWAVAALGPASKVADVGILGGAALLLGFSLVSAGQQAARAAPLRRTLEAFFAESKRSAAPPQGGSTIVSRPLTLAPISFEGVSCVHAGALHATPWRFSHRWSEPRGLAVSGPNGAGKSTLVHALLGLIAPSAGHVAVDGVPLDELDLADYRRRVAYLPQGAFVAPGESVAWHLRLFAGRPIADEQLDAALAEVGLLDVLKEHARKAGKAPRDVLAGELSGGERQRMHLCRALIYDAEMVILDEPEVALDQAGRDLVRGLLERLAKDRRVLVVAHDDSIIPGSFQHVSCARKPSP
jgi:ABC-type multidrug transport system fused ATPase/permease subunit